MRVWVGVLCFVLAGVSGYVMRLPESLVEPKFESAGWLHRQKVVLELFDEACEDSTNPTIVRLASEFSFDNALAEYSIPDLMINFRNLYEGKGLLPKGDIFSEYNQGHLEELQLVYNLLYYANNFDVFYSTAAWARQNVNCGIFVDALYAAVIHRRDTEKLAVPAPYELFPNYFVRRDVIAKAILLFQNKDAAVPEIEGVHNVGHVYTIDANYTGAFFDNADESKMAYFTEDVGLNTHYLFVNLLNPHWMNRVYDGTNKRGEYWYHIIRQLNARYNLERLTNGLNEVEGLSWDVPIRTMYDSMLMYTDGKFYNERISNVEVNPDDVAYLTNIETSISSLATQMNNFNKTFMLNTIFDLITSGDKNYESVARRMLGGNNIDNSIRLPSVLEHYATSLRDPLYWQLNKQMLSMYNDALNVLTPYTRNELYFSGVEIMNVEVKKILTYYDYFQFDVTDSVKPNDIDDPTRVNIGQPRLNHKPFSIMVNVSSLVAQKALVKIYLGPKFLPNEIALKKDSLFLLDAFEYNLKLGSNLITRKSDQITSLADDFISLKDLYKRVEGAQLGLEPLSFTNIGQIVGFPDRLILPKGTVEGITLQLYVIVAPFVKSSADSIYETGINTEILSPGYPFDRRIDDAKLFDLPNTMFRDILITHKGDNKVLNYGGEGVTTNWYSTGTYDPESSGKSYDYTANKQPYDYTANKQTYDYTAKKGPFETKKFDYKTKKIDRTVTERPTTDKPIQPPTVVKTTTENVINTDLVLPINVQRDLIDQHDVTDEKYVIPVHKDIIVPEIINKHITVDNEQFSYETTDNINKNISPFEQSVVPVHKDVVVPNFVNKHIIVEDDKAQHETTDQNNKYVSPFEQSVVPVHKDVVVPNVVNKHIIVDDDKVPRDTIDQSNKNLSPFEQSVVPVHKDVVVPNIVNKHIIVDDDKVPIETIDQSNKIVRPFEQSVVSVHKDVVIPNFVNKRTIVNADKVPSETIEQSNQNVSPFDQNIVSVHKDVVIPNFVNKQIIVDDDKVVTTVKPVNLLMMYNTVHKNLKMDDAAVDPEYIKFMNYALNDMDEYDSRELVYY